MSVVDELHSLLSQPRRIAVTMHQRPDGDAIGSALAWSLYLRKKGHQVSTVSPTEYPDFLKWLSGSDQLLVGPEDPDRATWAFDGADIIFCLDFNALHRLADFQKAVEDSEGTIVMIDHHMEPEDFADYSYSDETASSTAELIYRLIRELGDEALLDEAIGECLYAGIMTDTGSFRFTNTSPDTHRAVAHLMDLGVDPNRVYDEIYNQSSVDRLRFTGQCLSECMTVLPEFETAYLKVPRSVFRGYNIRTGDTEGLVNYALSIKGIKLAVLITEKDNLVKLSFRSRANISSNDMAHHFSGGGHFYAAGGRSKASIDEVEQELLDLLAARYKPASSEEGLEKTN